jgi:hypothetical protein
MKAIKNVRMMNGTKNPMPYVAPVVAYETMLGPSFSPSITRMPGPATRKKSGRRRP